MMNDLFQKVEQYLIDNLNTSNSIGNQILDFITDNNLDSVFTDFGVSILSSIYWSDFTFKAKRSYDHSNEEIDGENLRLWLSQQVDKNESFQQVFHRFLFKKGYEDDYPKLYNKIFMDRRVFSHIASYKNSQLPEKKTLFKLIIGLELNLSEAEELLKSAGYSFNEHKKFDLIIKYCIEHAIYNPITIDSLLIRFDEASLFT